MCDALVRIGSTITIEERGSNSTRNRVMSYSLHTSPVSESFIVQIYDLSVPLEFHETILTFPDSVLS